MKNLLTSDLINTAIEMRSNAYAPYSNYKVGAAIQTNNNIIFGGCNIENSSYSLTCCAERVAIFKAISEGYKKFTALSVSTINGGMPCGACRQVIWDLCGNIPIYICNNKNLIKTVNTIDLIPDPFDKNKLK
tara:strand:- start:190 stop:585 length:396 start_codon:yes stop_codon:yes gene_type:complete